MTRCEEKRSAGFAPIVAGSASLLILGSLPGQQSLAAHEYYAHPRNAFWRIMHELFDISGAYDDRCRQLTEQGIALWDVLASSVRPGSMDSKIRLDTARPNDFASFLSEHGNIRRICFNGRKAEQLFRSLVLPEIRNEHLQLVNLPSTSPAHAALSYERKLDAWSAAIANPMEGN